MSHPRRLLLLVAGLLVVAAMLVIPALSARLSGPMYRSGSTLLLDANGLSVLREALERQPGMTVRRHTETGLPPARDSAPRTLVLANPPTGFFSPNQPGNAGERERMIAMLDAEVRRGTRLVVLGYQAFRWLPPRPPPPEPGEVRERPVPAYPHRRFEPREPLPRVAFDIGISEIRRTWAEPRRSPLAPSELPPTIDLPDDFFHWSNLTSLDTDSGNVWYTMDTQNLLIRVPWGEGEVLVLHSHEIVGNLLLRDSPSNREIARWLFGAHPEILFLEHHLDPKFDRGLVAMARRYGLFEGYLLIIGLGLLIAWHRSVPLVPPPPAPEVNVLPYEPTAGLEALLRQAVPPADLARTCREQATLGARPGEAARIASLPNPLPDPVADHHLTVETLRSSPKFSKHANTRTTH